MRIIPSTLQCIKQKFYSAPIESGGIIGSKEGVVCAFYFDDDNYNYDCYVPNVKKMNAKIAEWADSGIQFAGVIHSHHNDCRLFSDADACYASEVQKSAGDLTLYFPIVTICRQNVVITPYVLKNGILTRERIVVVRN